MCKYLVCQSLIILFALRKEMNLPNLEAIINRSEVKPMKNNYNFLLKADKGLKMGLGKTREANNVMGLASPANAKQYNSTHILP